MLAHLENLDLSSLLEHFDWLHVRFLDSLDGSLSSSHFMCGELDQAKLTFAKSLAKLIEVKEVCKAHGLEKHLHPLFLLLLRAEVQYAGLVGRQNDLDRIEHSVSLRALLLSDFFYKSASQAVHDAALGVRSIPVAEDLVAIQDSPVLLEPISLGLEIAWTLHEGRLFSLWLVRETLMDLIIDTARSRGQAFIGALAHQCGTLSA